MPSFGWIKDLFTEKDGVSVCPVRTGFWIALGVYTFHCIGAPVEQLKDIAEGYGNIIGYGGAATAVKNFTESA